MPCQELTIRRCCRVQCQVSSAVQCSAVQCSVVYQWQRAAYMHPSDARQNTRYHRTITRSFHALFHPCYALRRGAADESFCVSPFVTTRTKVTRDEVYQDTFGIILMAVTKAEGPLATRRGKTFGLL